MKFKFFPSLHRIFSTRPSVIPPAVTTGIGPQGRKVTYFQPPDGVGHIIDPSLLTEGPPQPPHLWVFSSNITNMRPPQSPPFVQSASLPAFSTPSHAPSPIPIGDKNAEPPSQPPPQKHGPKPSLFSDAAMDKARASIKLLPKKHTFEESIIDISKYVSVIVLSIKLIELNHRENIRAMDARAAEDRKFKMRKLLLEEFREGLWSREDYRKQIKKLDSSGSASSRSSSPPWDVEEKGSLPDDDEDL